MTTLSSAESFFYIFWIYFFMVTKIFMILLILLLSLVGAQDVKLQKPVLIQNETIVSGRINTRENKLSQNNVTLPISTLLLKPKSRIYLLSDLLLFRSLQTQLPA